MKLSGMWRDALNGLLRRPVTQNYPFERLEAPDRLRSKLHWNLSSCTGCGLCAKDCPADAIEVITLDRKAKRFVFRYHVDRCTFCGQCVVLPPGLPEHVHRRMGASRARSPDLRSPVRQ